MLELVRKMSDAVSSMPVRMISDCVRLHLHQLHGKALEICYTDPYMSCISFALLFNGSICTYGKNHSSHLNTDRYVPL